MAFEHTLLCFGIEEHFEGAVDGEAADAESEVVGGDIGNSMGFVEDEEVFWEEDSGDIGAGIRES